MIQNIHQIIYKILTAFKTHEVLCLYNISTISAFLFVFYQSLLDCFYNKPIWQFIYKNYLIFAVVKLFFSSIVL